VDKAVERAESRYILRSGPKGNPLLDNFPYSSLTRVEIVDLFRAHNIRLGSGDLDADSIISALQHLNRQDFDQLLQQANDVIRVHGVDHTLSIMTDARGSLVFQ
jgi:hypothetical protein